MPTRVDYPATGLSHFQMWQDNLRISAMHTRLFFGMLPRMPKLLWRKVAGSPQREKSARQQHWSDIRESGAYAGMAISVACYRLFGRRALYGLLYVIIGYFFLSNRQARAHSADFLQRVYAQQPDAFGGQVPNWRHSFQHFMAFGRSIVDRIGSWVGDIRREEAVFANRPLLLDCLATGRGGVILTSHLGNAELCRGLVDGVDTFKINVLVFNDNAAEINRLMKRVNPRVDVELIQIASVGPDTGMLLADKINSGEFIVIAGDRTSPTAPEQATVVPFMGQAAAFPKGAFILAGLLDCPVFTLFCLEQQGRYHIYLDAFADTMAMPRRQRAVRLREHTQRYAQRLEHYALTAPLQWFNFFDFWALPEGLAHQAPEAATDSAKENP
jgi:predicted LPLAT superfamily acyltransferase